MDIVSYAAQKLDLDHQQSKRPDELQVVQFLNREVKNLADISRRNPWFVISNMKLILSRFKLDRKKSLKKAALYLSHPHCHRIWIVEQGVPTGVISQLDLLHALLENKNLFKDLLQERVQTLFPESRGPFVVSEQVYDSYFEMIDIRVQ